MGNADHEESQAQVVEYLAAGTPAAAIPGADAPHSQSISGTFRPGWEVSILLYPFPTPPVVFHADLVVPNATSVPC